MIHLHSLFFCHQIRKDQIKVNYIYSALTTVGLVVQNDLHVFKTDDMDVEAKRKAMQFKTQMSDEFRSNSIMS